VKKVRHADAYGFALLREKDKVTPWDLKQWEFYPISTEILDREMAKAKSISLTGLKTYATSVGATIWPPWLQVGKTGES
jgi:hypothetical protein